MKRKQQRFLLVIVFLALVGAAAAMVLYALGSQVNYFKDPSVIKSEGFVVGQQIRSGGLVVVDSLQRLPDATVNFQVTDNQSSIDVSFKGLLPDLFAEGQGVVVEGAFNVEGVLIANKVLAKHDETYMPKEVAESLKNKGVWKGEPQ